MNDEYTDALWRACMALQEAAAMRPSNLELTELADRVMVMGQAEG